MGAAALDEGAVIGVPLVVAAERLAHVGSVERAAPVQAVGQIGVGDVERSVGDQVGRPSSTSESASGPVGSLPVNGLRMRVFGQAARMRSTRSRCPGASMTCT